VAVSGYFGGNAGNEVFRDFSPGPRSGVDPDPHTTVAPDQIDKRAKAALVLGVLSFVFGFVTGLPALWVGRKSLQHVAASHGELRGRRMAASGMVLGVVGIVFTSAAWVYLHQHPSLDSAVAVANRIGCTDVQQSPEPGPDGSRAVTCTFHGDDVLVSWFDSSAAKDDFKANPPDDHALSVYGAHWAISCNRAAACAAAQRAMS
jgi:hypothetical protein